MSARALRNHFVRRKSREEWTRWLFCEETRLFCENTVLFCENIRLSRALLHNFVRTNSREGWTRWLFCTETGLFCENTGLFCENIRLSRPGSSSPSALSPCSPDLVAAPATRGVAGSHSPLVCSRLLFACVCLGGRVSAGVGPCSFSCRARKSARDFDCQQVWRASLSRPVYDTHTHAHINICM